MNDSGEEGMDPKDPKGPDIKKSPNAERSYVRWMANSEIRRKSSPMGRAYLLRIFFMLIALGLILFTMARLNPK